jgi:hypothetical protein
MLSDFILSYLNSGTLYRQAIPLRWGRAFDSANTYKTYPFLNTIAPALSKGLFIFILKQTEVITSCVECDWFQNRKASSLSFGFTQNFFRYATQWYRW